LGEFVNEALSGENLYIIILSGIRLCVLIHGNM